MDFTDISFVEDPFHSLEDLEGFNNAFLYPSTTQDCSQFGTSDASLRTDSQMVGSWSQQTAKNLWYPDQSSSSSRIDFPETKLCAEKPRKCESYGVDYADLYVNYKNNLSMSNLNTVPEQVSRPYVLGPDQNWASTYRQSEKPIQPGLFEGSETMDSPVVSLPIQPDSEGKIERAFGDISYSSLKSSFMESAAQNETQSSSNENSTVMNDSDFEGESSTFPFTVLKTKRRTPHNMIEKKYRSTINDAIRELKNVVSSPDEKLSKSGVLRSTLNYIFTLKQEKQKLLEEVNRLRKKLNDAGIETTKKSSTAVERKIPHSELPESFYPSSTSVSLDNSSMNLSGSSEPMVDKGRLTIFVLMFMFVIFNPLSVFMKKAPDSGNNTIVEDVIPGRMVLEYGDFETIDSEGIWWQSPIARPCFIWSVNVFVIICFLTRLLVFGEPVTDVDSSSWTGFLKLRTSAYNYIKSGDNASAERNLHECLRLLERPLPTAKHDEYISVIWQVIRHMLNSIWIGRSFSRIQRSAAKTVPVVCRSHAQTAIVYHLLNQLHLTRPSGECEKLAGLNFALCAVNLAESAGCSSNGLSHALRADIYINAALQMKLSLPSFIGTILSTYFMRRAMRHIRRAEEGAKRKSTWLFHPLARNFVTNKNFLSEHLRGKSSTFLPYIRSCSCAKPIERLLTVFKMKLLKILIEELNSSSGVGISYFREVSKLLFTTCSVPAMSSGFEISPVSNAVSFDSQGDEVCSWWTNVFICALYWRDDKYGNAADHYAAVRRCPKTLLTEPISLAVGHALCVRKLCIHDRDNTNFSNIVWFHSSLSLAQLRNLSYADHSLHIPSIVGFMENKIRLLSLEWLLMSFFDIWQTGLDKVKPYWEQLPSVSVRWSYEEILTRYRLLAKMDEKCKHKINVYELVSRVLNGTNPSDTWSDPLLSPCGKEIYHSRPFYVANNETTRLIEALRELFCQKYPDNAFDS